jgi:hypothetical protein
VAHEVHIAPGYSAAGCMKQALDLQRGDLLVHQDMLSCGPLPRVESLEEWARIREEYLRSLYPEWSDFSFACETDLLSWSSTELTIGSAVCIWSQEQGKCRFEVAATWLPGGFDYERGRTKCSSPRHELPCLSRAAVGRGSASAGERGAPGVVPYT